MSLATDAGGGLVFERRFLPYGDTRWQEGALPTDFGFGGQRHVPGTGLIFMHARYYHAGLGRFVSADTIVPGAGNPQDLNRYAYVRNSPLNYRDPTGHAADSYGNSWSVVDCPTCEPVSPEKVKEVAVFWAISVLAVVYGGPVLGDVAAAGWAGVETAWVKLIAWATAHPLEALVGKAVAEEAFEATVTGTPFDPGMVALDIVSQVGDDLLPRRQRGQIPLEQTPPGSLPLGTARQIQDVVDEVGAPINVVGGYARGDPAPRKDIDYYIEVGYRDAWTLSQKLRLPGPADFRPNNDTFFSDTPTGLHHPYIQFFPGQPHIWAK